MTELNDHYDKAVDEGLGQADSAELPPREAATVSRRALLKGATIAAPTVLTLSASTAALAATSVKVYTGVTSAQPDGSYYCLDEQTTLGYAPGRTDALEIGTSPTPEIYRIPERDYLDAANNAGNPKTEYEMCRDGGTYYYQNQGFPGVSVKKGILLSGNAMTSLGAAVLPVDNV